MTFEIIKYQRRLYLFLIAIPLSFIVFILSFYIGSILFKQFFPIGWMYIAFIIFLLFSYFIAAFFSRLRYSPFGKMYILENEIIIDSQEGKVSSKLNDIGSVRIYYAGDNFWKTRILNIHKSFRNNRYITLHWTNKENELKTLDKIFIDGKEYQIKIRDQKEKDNLIALRSLLERENVKVTWEELQNVQGGAA